MQKLLLLIVGVGGVVAGCGEKVEEREASFSGKSAFTTYYGQKCAETLTEDIVSFGRDLTESSDRYWPDLRDAFFPGGVSSPEISAVVLNDGFAIDVSVREEPASQLFPASFGWEIEASFQGRAVWARQLETYEWVVEYVEDVDFGTPVVVFEGFARTAYRHELRTERVRYSETRTPAQLAGAIVRRCQMEDLSVEEIWHASSSRKCFVKEGAVGTREYELGFAEGCIPRVWSLFQWLPNRYFSIVSTVTGFIEEEFKLRLVPPE